MAQKEVFISEVSALSNMMTQLFASVEKHKIQQWGVTLGAKWQNSMVQVLVILGDCDWHIY